MIADIFDPENVQLTLTVPWNTIQYQGGSFLHPNVYFLLFLTATNAGAEFVAF
jgi:hypothetical protein